MDSIIHTTIQRNCKDCPNLGECRIAKPASDMPPPLCPMQQLPINVISFEDMRLQIPEDPKYWARSLKQYLENHIQ